MVVTMKKVSLVVQEKNRQSALKKLRQAGMMHIQRDAEASQAPKQFISERQFFEKALVSLPRSNSRPVDITLGRADSYAKAREIIEAKNRENESLGQLAQFSKDMAILKPWGEFAPADIKALAEGGVYLHLIDATPERHKQLIADPDIHFIPIRRKKKTVSGVAVVLHKPVDGLASGISIPEYGIVELRNRIVELKKGIAVIQHELLRLSQYRNAMNRTLIAIRQDIEFEEVKSSMLVDDILAGFTGFVPVDRVDELQTLAAGESWALMFCDPDSKELVPTLIKNSPVTRIIQPVFRMMGILPGYHEPDISLWFLIFLSIFVAIILGDGAYGLIILILSGIASIKLKKTTDTLRLINVFGITTLIWGAVTGTWFSSLALVRDTPLRHLVIPALATYQDELFPAGHLVRMVVFPSGALDATTMMMWISLLLGIVMIVIARIQNFVRQLPSLASIAQLGWLSIILALYWLIMDIVLQLEPLPFIMELTFPMIIGGLLVVLVLGGQKKGYSFGRGLLQGLKDLLTNLLNIVGAFGDIISFIRLFAVGLVGVALSQSFNAMAPKGGGLALIAAVVILVFGHSLNLMLNALSVLVHGVRLNILEFSGHLDMEWTGFAFNPFRLHVPEMESPETDKE